LAPTVGIAATGFCYLGGILQLFHRRYQQILIDKISKFFIDKISKFFGYQQQPDRIVSPDQLLFTVIGTNPADPSS
jgi:hypothetical protein